MKIINIKEFIKIYKTSIILLLILCLWCYWFMKPASKTTAYDLLNISCDNIGQIIYYSKSENSNDIEINNMNLIDFFGYKDFAPGAIREQSLYEYGVFKVYSKNNILLAEIHREGNGLYLGYIPDSFGNINNNSVNNAIVFHGPETYIELVGIPLSC